MSILAIFLQHALLPFIYDAGPRVTYHHCRAVLVQPDYIRDDLTPEQVATARRLATIGEAKFYDSNMVPVIMEDRIASTFFITLAAQTETEIEHALVLATSDEALYQHAMSLRSPGERSSHPNLFDVPYNLDPAILIPLRTTSRPAFGYLRLHNGKHNPHHIPGYQPALANGHAARLELESFFLPLGFTPTALTAILYGTGDLHNFMLEVLGRLMPIPETSREQLVSKVDFGMSGAGYEQYQIHGHLITQADEDAMVWAMDAAANYFDVSRLEIAEEVLHLAPDVPSTIINGITFTGDSHRRIAKNLVRGLFGVKTGRGPLDHCDKPYEDWWRDNAQGIAYDEVTPGAVEALRSMEPDVKRWPGEYTNNRADKTSRILSTYPPLMRPNGRSDAYACI